VSDPTRPVDLGLFRIRLPLAGWVSILHRASGVLLFLALPLGVWALSVSLSSEAGFRQIAALASGTGGRVVILLAVWSLLHHWLAGLRHLAMDMHWGVARVPARRTGLAVLVASTTAALALAGCLFV